MRNKIFGIFAVIFALCLCAPTVHAYEFATSNVKQMNVIVNQPCHQGPCGIYRYSHNLAGGKCACSNTVTNAEMVCSPSENIEGAWEDVSTATGEWREDPETTRVRCYITGVKCSAAGCTARGVVWYLTAGYGEMQRQRWVCPTVNDKCALEYAVDANRNPIYACVSGTYGEIKYVEKWVVGGLGSTWQKQGFCTECPPLQNASGSTVRAESNGPNKPGYSTTYDNFTIDKCYYTSDTLLDPSSPYDGRRVFRDKYGEFVLESVGSNPCNYSE